MKKAKVLHNPEAGEGDTSKRELIQIIESAGFKCSYSSTKEFRWENTDTADIDFIILAGGDGTVRKIADELLGRKVLDKKLPIGLLPLGTANNIAKTLGLCGAPAEIIEGWRAAGIKKFDVGKIGGLPKPSFFLESFGYGLFPKLMSQMKKEKKDHHLEEPKEKLYEALKMVHRLILDAPLKNCSLHVDGKDYSGDFLLLEVMNTRSIGPNLNLAPDADPGDGVFDVVLITDSRRLALTEYVQKKMDGKEVSFDFPILKGRNLEMLWDGKHVHVDDEYHKLDKPARINIELREGLLEFLLPPG
jgi:diacylglycerol kinase (ATP)